MKARGAFRSLGMLAAAAAMAGAAHAGTFSAGLGEFNGSGANITESWVPFTAVIEMTALVDRAAFGGNALVYLPRYLTQEDPFWQRSDAEIRELFLGTLARMYPAFRREQVLAFSVSRVREVLAVSTLDYSARHLPPVATSLPGIHVVNSAQIANGTLNLNETIGLASQQARALAPRLRRAAPEAALPGRFAGPGSESARASKPTPSVRRCATLAARWARVSCLPDHCRLMTLPLPC